MSLQIIVATPYSYFGNWLSGHDTQTSVRAFYRSIAVFPELALPEVWSDDEYYCEDLSARQQTALYDWITKHQPVALDAYDADIFIPNNFTGKRKVRLPYYIHNDKDYYFASTFRFLHALTAIETELQRQEVREYSDLIQMYREAGELSVAKTQPIFFSY